jgi:hypothetical protein
LGQPAFISGKRESRPFSGVQPVFLAAPKSIFHKAPQARAGSAAPRASQPPAQTAPNLGAPCLPRALSAPRKKIGACLRGPGKCAKFRMLKSSGFWAVSAQFSRFSRA